MWRNVLMLAVLITVACPVPAADPLVVCRQNAESLELFCRDRLVLRYHTAVVEPPAGVDPVFRRSGFMHPVATPSGRVVTDDFPADHLHQHGIFCAWVNTTFEGRSVDFWNQKGRTGNVEHVRVIETHNDGSAAGFTVELQHLDLTAPNGPKTVLQELWTVTCRDAGELHLFDIDSRQALIEALNDFPGAVIVISHDRHLVEATADRLWLVHDGGVSPYDGDLDDYRQFITGAARAAQRAVASGVYRCVMQSRSGYVARSFTIVR